MDKSQDAYLKALKKDMIDALESGLLKPEEQYQLVNTTIKQMFLVRDDKITIVCLKYLDDQEKLTDSIKEKNNEIGKLQAEYVDNVKKIYEQIKKL